MLLYYLLGELVCDLQVEHFSAQFEVLIQLFTCILLSKDHLVTFFLYVSFHFSLQLLPLLDEFLLVLHKFVMPFFCLLAISVRVGLAMFAA